MISPHKNDLTEMQTAGDNITSSNHSVILQ